LSGARMGAILIGASAHTVLWPADLAEGEGTK
jgi:hypothetical protein